MPDVDFRKEDLRGFWYGALADQLNFKDAPPPGERRWRTSRRLAWMRRDLFELDMTGFWALVKPVPVAEWTLLGLPIVIDDAADTVMLVGSNA